MKWKMPKTGEMRVRCKFALLPVVVRESSVIYSDKWKVWLTTYWVIERFHEDGGYDDPDNTWISVALPRATRADAEEHMRNDLAKKTG